jgi:transposase-like protein
MQVEITQISCPNCSSKSIKKAGIQKTQNQKQRYKCKSCARVFLQQPTNKTYPLRIILKALSLYNLGHPQANIQKLIHTKQKPSQKTISNWISEFKPLLLYHRLRHQTKHQDPDEIIQTHTFMHNNLPYKFQIHTLKLKQLFQDTKFNHHSKFLPIKTYLEKIPTSAFPHHIFKPEHHIQNHSDRSSQIKFKHLKITTLSKSNLANKLTALALNLAKNNKQRHEVIQDFMLTNDSTTLATEVPIYLTKDDLLYFASKGFSLNPKDYNTPITGHVDLLQIRNNLVHILDYKPEANKTNPVEQLTIYALALASRTKLDLKSFKCAWFDENNYYEFFPLHVVYKKK